MEVTWNWPEHVIQPLSAALSRRLEPVDRKEHPLSSLIFGSLHFDGELSHRDMTGKADVKGKLFFAHADDVVYSKIDARNGAIGIVPRSTPRLVFSSEYPIYEVSTAKAIPDYVKLLFRMASFRERINSLVSGASGRKRVEPSVLESIEVPLPPLYIQHAIVDHWIDAQRRVTDARQRADECEQTVMSEFMAGLGLEIGGAGITHRAFALNWSEIDRWSLEFIRQKTGDLDPASGKFSVTTLGESIADLTNGWSPKCFDRPAQGEEWGVLKLGAVSFGQFNPSENKALPPSLKPRPEYEIRPGDVLISRANITRLVGACSHVVETPPRLMLCDKIFRIVFKDSSPVLPEYISEVMKIPHLRRQIEASVTGSSPTMKNITKPALLALRIPLPNPRIQRQLVERATQGRQDAASERAAAEKLARETTSEIESMILGHTPPPKPKTTSP